MLSGLKATAVMHLGEFLFIIHLQSDHISAQYNLVCNTSMLLGMTALP